MSAANRFRRGGRRGVTHVAIRATKEWDRAMTFVRWATVVVLISTVAIIAAAEENADTWILVSVAGGIALFGGILLMGARFSRTIAGFLLGESFARYFGRGEALAETVRMVTLRVAITLLLPVGAAVWASAVPIVDRPEVFGGLILVGLFSLLAVIAPPTKRVRRILIGSAVVALAGTSAWAYWDAGNEPVAWGIIGAVAIVALGFATPGVNRRMTVQMLIFAAIVGGLVWVGFQSSTTSSTNARTTAPTSTATTASSYPQCEEASWSDYGDPADGFVWYEIKVPDKDLDNCVWFELPDPGRWTDAVLLPATTSTWFEVEFPSTGARGTVKCNDPAGSLGGGAPYFLLHYGEGTAVLWAWNRGLIEDPWTGQPCVPS